jgi:putative ABC transport system permease protein
MVSGAIGYTSALTHYAIQETLKMDIVKQQLKNPTVDVLNGLPFATGEEKEPTAEEIKEAVETYLAGLDTSGKATIYTDLVCTPSQEYIDGVVQQQLGKMTREDIEKLIIEQYAAEMGVSADTITEYISKMSDEELFGMMEEAIAAQVTAQYAEAMAKRLSAMSIEQLAGMMDTWLTGDAEILAAMYMQPLTEAQYAHIHKTYLPATLSESNYEDNLDLLGYVDPESPSTISIYATTFADKDRISELIAEYNKSVQEKDQIEYTDYVALLMSSITSIISGISYLLIAFVSISLVVSSIMIGVITLISVQERTKEIGILRAIGASKKNVSGMFNAETVIIGLCAGLVGIGISFALTFPINAILYHFTEIAGLKAALPWEGAVVLVAISALLTLFAGLIPSRSAAKKDPVVALRTE